MGSISRMNRCGRFIQKIGPALLRKYQKYDFQMGDWWETDSIALSESDDGTETVKLFLTLKNRRTGDQHHFTQDIPIFDPEGHDHGSVHALASELCEDRSDYEKCMKRAVKLLKKADLINPKYNAEEEVP